MIRATTGGVLRSYRSSLMSSFTGLNKARDTVLTQRNFNSYAEDPAAAAKAFRLRKSRMAVESQYTICNSTISKYQSAFSCLDTIDKLIDTANGGDDSTLKSTTLEMLNDPKGDARVQLTKVLDQLSDTIVQNMNQTYAGNFIFAGADGHNVPFEVKDGKLYYRGVSVDASAPEMMKDSAGNSVALTDSTGAPVTSEDGDPLYLLAGAELVEELPQREMDTSDPANPTPIVVVAEDGSNYYLQAGADTPLTQAEFDVLSDDDKALYTASGVFVPPLDPNTKVYYKTEQLIPKDSYDTDAGKVMRDDDGNPYVVEVDGKTYHVVDGKNVTTTMADYEKACKEAEKLAWLVDEKQFVDIGLGFQEDKNGNLIESSGFNAALNGLTFLGYGLDEDGDPKNIYSIVQRLKEISESVPEEGQWSKPVYEEFRGLVLKLESASSKYKTEFTNLTASTTKLENNLDLLEDNHYTLQEQYSELEDVDMADAITSMLWAQYCYNAALKVGNSILGQSLMDYLS